MPRLFDTRCWLLDVRGRVFSQNVARKAENKPVLVTLLRSCCWIWHTHFSLPLRWLFLHLDKQACPGPSRMACAAGALWVCRVGSILTLRGANGSWNYPLCLCFCHETVNWNGPALRLITRLDWQLMLIQGPAGIVGVFFTVAGEQLRMQAKILTTQVQRLWLWVTVPELLWSAAWSSVCNA